MELAVDLSDKSEDFIHGMEAGKILNQLESGNLEVSNSQFPVRIENIDVISRLCHYYNYQPIWGKKYYGEWIIFKGVKKFSNDN